MSRDALASAVRISRRKLRAYETGATRLMPAELSAIATVLAVPISYFFDETGEARELQPSPLLRSISMPLERCSDIAEGRLLPALQAWRQLRDDHIARRSTRFLVGVG